MLHTLHRKTSFGITLVRGRQFRPIADALHAALWSSTDAYGMKRDLTVPFAAPDATLPLTIRRATDADVDHLFRLDATDIPATERGDRRDRHTLIHAGMRHNFVAVDAAGTPCYFQGVLTAADNAFIARAWKKTFPHLGPHQALLEGAFTPEAYRGRKIMPAAMARIAEASATESIHEAITFVTQDNIPSVKGCVRSGFQPYCTRTVTRRLFRHSTTYGPLPPGIVMPG